MKKLILAIAVIALLFNHTKTEARAHQVPDAVVYYKVMDWSSEVEGPRCYEDESCDEGGDLYIFNTYGDILTMLNPIIGYDSFTTELDAAIDEYGYACLSVTTRVSEKRVDAILHVAEQKACSTTLYLPFITAHIAYVTITDVFEDGSTVTYRCPVLNGNIIDEQCVEIGTTPAPIEW